jgi:hypothetical protein
MRTIFSLSILWIFCCAFGGDDPIKISVKDILIGVQQEKSVATNMQTTNFLRDLNYRLPLLKEFGVRYGSDDLTNAKRQYAAVFNFNTFKTIKEQQSIKIAQLSAYQAKKDVLLNEVIQERYMSMVDAYFAQSLLTKHRALDSLLNQKNTILKISLQKGMPIRVKDLVETEEDIRRLRLSMADIETIWELSYQKIRRYLGVQAKFELSFDNFIAVPKIEHLLNGLKSNKNIQNPELKTNQSEANLSQAALRLEEATFNKFFDGVQLIYEHKNRTEFSPQYFSFRVGVNIPIKGNLRPKQNELLLDIKDAENDYHVGFSQTEKRINAQILTLENLFKKYRLCQDMIQNSLSNNILNTPAVRNTLLPADIIDLKILQQKKILESINVQYEIVKSYIQLLTVNGDFVYSPRKNYLSNAMESW